MDVRTSDTPVSKMNRKRDAYFVGFCSKALSPRQEGIQHEREEELSEVNDKRNRHAEKPGLPYPAFAVNSWQGGLSFACINQQGYLPTSRI
jgi:hypothetical protein